MYTTLISYKQNFSALNHENIGKTINIDYIYIQLYKLYDSFNSINNIQNLFNPPDIVRQIQNLVIENNNKKIKKYEIYWIQRHSNNEENEKAYL